MWEREVVGVATYLTMSIYGPVKREWKTILKEHKLLTLQCLKAEFHSAAVLQKWN